MHTLITLLASGAMAIILCIPLIIYFFFYRFSDKKLQTVYVGMNTQQGHQLMPIKAGPSGSILLFPLLIPGLGQLSLAFRGQYMEWLSWFIATLIVSIIIGVTPLGIDPNITNANDLTTYNIIGMVLTTLTLVIPMYYFVPFANKSRLKKLVLQGANIRNSYNDVDKIYEYLGMDSSQLNKPVPDGAVRGQTHNYMVPDSKNDVAPKDDPNDWSHLTTQDLKLLLKSEGIPYVASSTKEELLQLCDEHLRTEVKDESNDWSHLTAQDLKLLLKSDGIPYAAGSTKEELLELCEEHLKPKVKKEPIVVKESPYDNMTVAQLMDELESRKITYKKNMNKKELRDLLNKEK